MTMESTAPSTLPSAPPAFVVRTMQAVQRAMLSVSNKMSPPHMKVLELGIGVMHGFTIHAAARLGIADVMSEEPMAVDQIAARIQAHAPSLYRLLRTLVSLGIFTEPRPRCFALNDVARTLRADAQPSVKPLALLIGHASWAGTWQGLEHAVRTGANEFEHLQGEELFDYLTRHPDTAETFDSWMTQITLMRGPFVVTGYDFGSLNKLVDVGGGRGALLAMILRTHGRLRGVLFDQPQVVATVDTLDEDSIRQRCEVVGGDFFESVPEGADGYLLQQIIHDWDDERARKILANCRRAMAPGGRVLVVDSVMRSDSGPDQAKIFDLHLMLLTSGGRERTEEEFRALFASAGLELAAIHHTPVGLAIIEGRADGAG